jgi:hypothetical protein
VRATRLVQVARVGAPAAAVAVVLAGLLPWTASGEVVRNSFATVRSARLLGIGDHAVITAVLGAWYFVPAVAGLSCLAAVLGRNRLAGIGAAVVGGAALLAATAVLHAPLSTGAGPWVALVAGAVALASGLALVARPA